MSQLPFSLLQIGPDAAGPALGGVEGPDMTRYLLVCSGLLLVIVLLAFGFRRVVGRSLVARAGRRSLQVVDVLPVGGKQRLTVVRCYDRVFLLGVGEREMSLVAELDRVLDSELAPEGAPLPEGADREAFARMLERARPRPAPGRPGRAEPGEAAGVLTPRPARAPLAAEENGGPGWVG